jgi:hypothetical protein
VNGSGKQLRDLLVYDPSSPPADAIRQRLDAVNMARCGIPSEKYLRDAMRECRRKHFANMRSQRITTHDRLRSDD